MCLKTSIFLGVLYFRSGLKSDGSLYVWHFQSFLAGPIVQSMSATGGILSQSQRVALPCEIMSLLSDLISIIRNTFPHTELVSQIHDCLLTSSSLFGASVITAECFYLCSINATLHMVFEAWDQLCEPILLNGLDEERDVATAASITASALFRDAARDTNSVPRFVFGCRTPSADNAISCVKMIYR